MAYPGRYHRPVTVNYRKVLSDNVSALMKKTPELSSHAKLAKRCSTPTRTIGARTIGHLLNWQEGPQPQLDTIIAVAQAFKVECWMLLYPSFDAETLSVAGRIGENVVELAARITGLPEERQQLLMEIFAKDGVPDMQRAVHEPAARRYDPGRAPRAKK